MSNVPASQNQGLTLRPMDSLKVGEMALVVTMHDDIKYGRILKTHGIYAFNVAGYKAISLNDCKGWFPPKLLGASSPTPAKDVHTVQAPDSVGDCTNQIGQLCLLDEVEWRPFNKDAVKALIAALVERETAGLREGMDGAYAERNQLVAALSKLYPAGQKKTALPGWDEAWHNCIYIDLPTGQASWHIHDREMAQFAHLPTYAGEWDGHDTPEKYRRLAALAPQPASQQDKEG